MKSILSFDSVVIKGRGEGRKLGFPTINLEERKLALGYGVYVCMVKVSAGVFDGALSYGARPTFDINEPACEIFLLDFSGDLYGQNIQVTVYNKIRDVMKFKSAEDLKMQISEDVLAVRKFFKQINN